MASASIDVFVAGGGPAGLAVAIAARKQGLSVAVADPAHPPIDKACGEGIMPAGVDILRRLGIDVGQVNSAPFRGIKFLDRSGEVSANFSRGTAYGVRRTTLHRAMVAQAERCGVELHWGTRVTGLSPAGVLIEGQEIGARFMVCADGQKSTLRAAAGFCEGRTLTRRYGFRQHYAVRPWSEFVEVHWSNLGQMYVTPVSANEIGVALLTSNKRLSFDEALPHFPALAERLQGCEPSTRLMGAVTATRYLPEVVRGNVALVGDASGSPDAITGDGLSLAFRQAIVLVNAMSCDNLSAYQREHRRIARRPLTMGRLLLMMDGRPVLRGFVFRVLRANPALFTTLLHFHTGNVEPVETQENVEVAA